MLPVRPSDTHFTWNWWLFFSRVPLSLWASSGFQQEPPNSITFLLLHFPSRPYISQQHIPFHLYPVPVYHGRCPTTEEPSHTRNYHYSAHHQWWGSSLPPGWLAISTIHSYSHYPRTTHGTKCLRSNSLKQSLRKGFRAMWFVEEVLFRKSLFCLFVCFSKPYTQHEAWTHNPKIKSRVLRHLSQPGVPSG